MRIAHFRHAFLLTCLACAAQVHGQAEPPPAHARAKLICDTSAIVAGKPFTLAVAFEMDPGWHLYWKDPGDSGMPPSVKWTLPDGFVAGKLQFPKPEILKTPAGVNYVYEKSFALLVTITPPAELGAGQTIDIKAAIKWLECTLEQCLPAKQSAELSVETGTEAQPANEAQFVEWRAAVKAGEHFDPTKAE